MMLLPGYTKYVPFDQLEDKDVKEDNLPFTLVEFALYQFYRYSIKVK
jgi:hypothetical protein